MASYAGGMQVNGGYYWNPRSWEVEVVPSEGGRLKGATGTKYMKLPFPLLFVVVPLLGALFLVFLPLIGFALFGHAIVKKVTGGVKRSATELASTVVPGGFATGEAHFTGKPGEEKEKAGEGKAQAEIEKLAKEIEERKNEKK
jgi:hypothetical protein